MSSLPRGRAALWLPWLLYLYPAVGAIFARSEVPQFLGRYSLAFLILNAWNLFLLVLLAYALTRRNHVATELGYVLLVLTSLVLPANNAVAALPAIRILLPLIRLGAGMAIVVAAFAGRRRAPAFLAIAALVATVSVLDVALLGWLALSPDELPGSGLRRDYDLSAITDGDDVILGDSFVWGQGVSESERFGDRLEALYAADGHTARVYSLGLVGVGPEQYLELLSSLPRDVRARRVIVAFYMNDMPPIETLSEKMYGATVALGRGSATLRLVGDRLARFWLHDVDAYHAKVVRSYDRSTSSYEARWKILVDQLSAIQRKASRHSARKPLLLVLPLMVDFEHYPLESAHEDLAVEAKRLGYETLDLLPVFCREIHDAMARRAARDDNHYDAFTHDLIARALHRAVGD